jgi:hypothetical protein
MSLRDLLHSVKANRGISPVSGGANDTASVSQVIDMQGYAGCLFVFALGALPMPTRPSPSWSRRASRALPAWLCRTMR